MKKRYYFCWKNLKRIPVKKYLTFFGVFIFWILMMIMFVQYIFIPIDNTNKGYWVDIKHISIDSSLGKNGGTTLELTSSDGVKYYCHYSVLFYPGTGFRHYRDKIESDLESGKVKRVIIKESNNQTWQGVKNYGIRIAEMKTETEIYYDSVIDRVTILHDKIGFGVLFFCSSFFLLIYLVIIQHSYKIIRPIKRRSNACGATYEKY